MSRDLEQLLHRTAVEPSGPLDTAQMVARGRRRRRVRHATAAAGSVAAVLIAVAVVLGGPVTEPQPPEIVERPDPSEPRPDDPGDDEADAAEDESSDPGAEEVERISPDEAGHPLLVADDRGVHRVGEDGEQPLWDTAAALALPDHDGGAVIQEADGGAIRRLTADGGESGPPLAAPEEQPVLHAVVEHDGRPTVLFTRRGGEGDAETETLHAHRLDDATEEDLGVTGMLESGISGVALVDGDLVLSRCHLECDLVRVPWGADPEGEQAVELHDRALPIHGLDGYDTTAAYVHLPQHVPDTDDQADDPGQPDLWLHDLADDDRDEVALPPPEDLDTPTISVDLTADGSAALIGFHPPDGTATQTLLADDLDGQPRLRWLDATGHHRFDAPG